MTAVLYSYRRCPYAMRARMALAYSGIPVEIREISLREKPASMLAISPKGTVPVLQGDDLVLEQSYDIMKWALKNRPAVRREHQPWRCGQRPDRALRHGDRSSPRRERAAMHPSSQGLNP